MLPIELCLAILEYVLEPGALERRGADAMDASEFTVICRTWRKALDARVRRGVRSSASEPRGILLGFEDSARAFKNF